jgi:hypothetical protein
MSDLEVIDVNEDWREYDWTDPKGNSRVYRIVNVRKVAFKKGGGTHRVLDAAGVWHVTPAVGWYGCVIRFEGELVR